MELGGGGVVPPPPPLWGCDRRIWVGVSVPMRVGGSMLGEGAGQGGSRGGGADRTGLR